MDEYKIVEAKNKPNSSMNNNGNNSRSFNNNGATANPGTSSMEHGSNDDDDVEIPKSLRTKGERSNAFQKTIPNWIESRTIMPFNSKKAMEFHQGVFEMIVLDNHPFTIVNDRGFLRLLQKMAPNFEVIGQYLSVFCPITWKYFVFFRWQLISITGVSWNRRI